MQGQYPAMNLEIVSQKFFFQFLKRNSNLTTVIKLGFEESWFLSTGHQNSSQQEKNCDSIHSAWRHLDTTESQVTLYVGCGLWVCVRCPTCTGMGSQFQLSPPEITNHPTMYLSALSRDHSLAMAGLYRNFHFVVSCESYNHIFYF